MPDGYDAIGDIHGHAEELKALLTKLGYEERGGAYRHSTHTAIFIGDYIDRGPNNLEVVRIVRAMVDAGTAHHFCDVRLVYRHRKLHECPSRCWRSHSDP